MEMTASVRKITFHKSELFRFSIGVSKTNRQCKSVISIMPASN